MNHDAWNSWDYFVCWLTNSLTYTGTNEGYKPHQRKIITVSLIKITLHELCINKIDIANSFPKQQVGWIGSEFKLYLIRSVRLKLYTHKHSL